MAWDSFRRRKDWVQAQPAWLRASTGDLSGVAYLVTLYFYRLLDVLKAVRVLVASPSNRWNLFAGQIGESLPAVLDRHCCSPSHQDNTSYGWQEEAKQRKNRKGTRDSMLLLANIFQVRCRVCRKEVLRQNYKDHLKAPPGEDWSQYSWFSRNTGCFF